MKKYLIFLFCFLFNNLNINFGGEIKFDISKLNGENWIDFSMVRKNSIAMGFLVCADLLSDDIDGFSIIEEAVTTEEKNEAYNKSQSIYEQLIEVQIKIIKNNSKNYCFYGTNSVTIVDAIDEFYKDTRNRRILLKGAFKYISISLNGGTDEELKDELEHLRVFEIPNPDSDRIIDYTKKLQNKYKK